MTPRLVCLLAAVFAFISASPLFAADGPIPFEHELIAANAPFQSHCKGVGDFDGDGQLDVAIGSGWDGDGLYWYEYPDWTRYTIVPPGVTGYSTDMQVADVDGDGDPDIVIPKGYYHGSSTWWYENPRPGGNPRTAPWPEHFIGNGSAHDVVVGDIDKNGRIDVVTRYTDTWLFLQTGPDTWSRILLEDGNAGDEGTALGDVDGDGDLDVALNGRWRENPLPSGNPAVASAWITRTFDASWPVDGKVFVADLNADGKNDIVLGRSEKAGSPLVWYEATNPRTGPWTKRTIDPTADFNHSIQVGDVDLDGDLDVVVAEMLQSSGPDEVRVFYNVGGSALSWVEQIVSTKGSHDIRLADFDADGDLDIFGANWDGSTGVDLWRNRLDPSSGPLELDQWQTHLIDGALAYQAVTIDAADLDSDGDLDILAGGWWYTNPGSASGTWTKRTIGSGLENVGIAADIDEDGDVDILGTSGTPIGGAVSWARNNGSGTFTIFGTPPDGPNQFLQGFLARHLSPGGPLQVALSWHGVETSPVGVQLLTVPADPANQAWSRIVLQEGEEEALSAGDIDGDGDLDIFQGSLWQRNDGTSWTQFRAATFPSSLGLPDRNVLRDIDRDGDLDAVVGFKHATTGPTDLIWLEAPQDPTATWTQHVIASGVGGGYALDAADLDHDGDIDVVLGEHEGETRLLIFENTGGGASWTQHVVHPGGAGIDHHLGARLFDLDGDGDLDIISVGWKNPKVWIFENLASPGGGGGPDFTPPSTPTGLSATATSSSSIALSWSASTDDRGTVASYRIFRNGSFAATASSTSYTDSGLSSGTTYTYTVSALDPSGNESGRSAPASTTTLASSGGGGSSSSDDFGGCALDSSIWTIVDPVGDGSVSLSTAGASDAVLSLAVPAGTDHDLWTPGNKSLRVVQSLDNADFEATVKFLSTLSGRHQIQGIHVASGQGSFVRFDLNSDNSGTYLFGAVIQNSTATTYLNSRVPSASPSYLRMSRSGNQWTFSYSTDGSSFSNVASFTYAMNAASIGIHAGTAGGNPAHTALVDWFELSGDPIANEDSGGGGSRTVTTFVSGPGSITQTPSGTDIPCGTTVTFEAVPTSGASFVGWTGDINTAQNPVDVLVTKDLAITATFSGGSSDTTPPSTPAGLAATATSPTAIDLTWNPSTDDSGTIASYRIFRDGTLIATAGGTSYTDTGLASGTTYTYRVSSLDPSGNESGLSAPASATTSSTADTTPPSVPTGLSASPASPSAIDVFWNPSTDDSGTVASYRVFRNGGFVANVSGTGYTDSGLLANTTYTYTASAVDPSGNESGLSSPASASTLASTGAGLLSDDFDGCALDSSLWTVVDPVGDGSVTLANAGADAVLELSVPAGTDHDLWTPGNKSVRVTQPLDDEDFEVSVKFLSTLTRRYQIQGLHAEDPRGNFVRFDLNSDGTGTYLFGAVIENATYTKHLMMNVPSASPTYLRMARNGNDWTFSYSTDGSSYSLVASFSKVLTVTSIGIHAGNAGGNPAHTAVVDWFIVDGDSLANEDSGSGASRSVSTSVSGPGSIAQTPTGTEFPCGTTVTFEAIPDSGASFVGWSGDVSSAENPIDVVVTDDLVITAVFSSGDGGAQSDTTPPLTPTGVAAAPASTSAIDVSWNVSTDDSGAAPSYRVFRDGVLAGTTTSTAFTDTGLTSETTYTYTVTAVDPSGNESAPSSSASAATLAQ